MEEQFTTTTEAASAPQVIHIQPEKNNRPALWVLISVSIGFLLPVCSCAIFMLAGFIGLSALDPSTTTFDDDGTDAIAIVRVEGTILSGDETDVPAGATSGTVIKDLEAAADNPAVKAIVLRVDSPGGSVTGSAQIHEVIEQIEKPVIVSMSGVAASGGYYVSAPADYIFARADTLTGSLGVIMTLYNAAELIDEIGVDVINITSGPNKAIGSSWDELTPEHQTILEAMITESYDEFVRIIVDGREMDEETVRALADGRIYTGRQAQENGLVDELGNFNDAIAKAADMGGISGDPRIIEYEHIPSFENVLLGFSARLTRTQADEVIDAINEFSAPTLEYRYVGPASQ